jgi:pimeloyl-ACP methyl ester carboxylesterase
VWRSFGHSGPRGPKNGPPALVIPGFLADDRTVLEIRRAMAEAGWRSFAAEQGWNLGARTDTIERLRARLDAISPGRPVLVVGWSLGGVFARELARQHPDRVLAVATLGSPFSGEPRLNNVWRLYEWVAGHPVDDPPIQTVLEEKPPVPTLAIWSRRDGIVSVACARGEPGESDRQVELDCSHMGFAVSGKFYPKIVAALRDFDRQVAG